MCEKLLLRSALNHTHTCQTLFHKNAHSKSIKKYRSRHRKFFWTQLGKKITLKYRNVEKNYKKRLLRSKQNHAQTCQTLFHKNAHSESNKKYRYLYKTLWTIKWDEKIPHKYWNVEKNYEKRLLRSASSIPTTVRRYFSKTRTRNRIKNIDPRTRHTSCHS